MTLHCILGDIHGNREALLAVLAALAGLRPERIWCVGDIVGYNADPNDCAAIVREHGVASIAGNHDLIGIGRLGFQHCSAKARYALERTRRCLEPAAAEYPCSLPATLPLEEHAVLVHGGVRDVQQYLRQTRDIEENAHYLRCDFPGRKLCFFGHVHEQVVFEVRSDGTALRLAASDTVQLRPEASYFINPGSVDASRKRGGKMAEFALFDSSALTVQFCRTPYDGGLTAAKATRNGYRIGPWRARCYGLRQRFLRSLG